MIAGQVGDEVHFRFSFSILANERFLQDHTSLEKENSSFDSATLDGSGTR